ncbi:MULTISPECIES: YiiX/YebB-like N1pC/P60 family cysteine hydrolase [unclassified Francisella]|uniref:YiiX/YebB-like N1pC/P60 family cysteine hydrolase n=1 Tax=unclassified Francisella TaxID=2610885 RepID=UPI002E3606C4|nr:MULTISPECIES: YiiX/YebB-like N1pC/P60 family cysteine hydrolase [unclassified Francisella]MED7820394.1 YiiX/YebB-like N1pC/P60 family cysteine hydrolase [Francisella sp. 19S2-4]MED7831230.1 YiiX/YebB-like N1pC/P60 family cysteine hydrolase [Francisella sp. 19S2-10]
MKKIKTLIYQKISSFLLFNISQPRISPLSDYNKLVKHLEVCDVILVEGRSRAARAISVITRSIWTHSALYIGNFEELTEDIQELILKHNSKLGSGPLIIESNIGEGVVIKNLNIYELDHLRICRPRNISKIQQNIIINYVLSELGLPYDNQQIFDLARFFCPWWILPRKWHSSLFNHNAQNPTKLTCSLLIATAFIKAKFPILPLLEKTTDGKLNMRTRNPRLFVPSDFDYSPFFEIIKYPIVEFDIFKNQYTLY